VEEQMLDADDESSKDLNVWISMSDLFAGLLLIMIIGLIAALHGRNSEEIRVSDELGKAMTQATELTTKMREKLNKIRPEFASQTPQSETEVVIPAGALFEKLQYDDYLTDPKKRQLLTDIRSAVKQTIDEAGDERKFFRIVIEGHTDSDPIGERNATECIPTNWELSSRRATGVLRFFEEGGMSAKEYNIVALGLADTDQLGPNNTDQEKSLNRRIVIRVEPIIEKMRMAAISKSDQK
jgi:chemotaxis protein MotB